MAAGIDMSLDDIINTSAAAHRRSNSHGPDRRFAVRKPVRKTPYSIPPQGREAWPRSIVPEMLLDDGAAPETQTETGTKLYVSNLDYDVSNEDIKLLFSEEGELKRYSIHYDRSGRSKGTAEVVFTRKSDALEAIKKYNNMRLDGKPLKIELVGTSLDTPAVMPLGQRSIMGRPNDVYIREQGQVGGSRYRNSFTSGHLPRGRGEGQDRFRKVSFRDLDHGMERYHRRPGGHTGAKGHFRKLSVKELDEDLERYRLEGMQIDKENGRGNHD